MKTDTYNENGVVQALDSSHRTRVLRLFISGLLLLSFASTAYGQATSPVMTAGSGFVVHPDGYVATCAHLVRAKSATLEVEDARIEVVLEEHAYPAELIQLDREHNLALLKIDVQDHPWLPLAERESVALGQEIRAFGHSRVWKLGRGVNLARGIVSSLSTDLTDEQVEIEASTKAGNAGGPFVSLNGQVVGVIPELSQGTCISVGYVKELLSEANVTCPTADVGNDLNSVELTKNVVACVAHVRVTPTRLVIHAHKEAVSEVAFLRRGSVLATASTDFDDGTAKIWNLSGGALLASMGGTSRDKHITAMTTSPDDKTVALGMYDGRVFIYAPPERKGRKEWTLKGSGVPSDEMVRSIAISADARTLATNQWTRTVHLWDISKQSLIRTFQPATTEGLPVPPAIALSPDGTLLAIEREGDQFGEDELHVYDAQTGRLKRSFTPGVINEVTFSPDGSSILVQPGVNIWDVRSGKRQPTTADRGRAAFAANGTMLATATSKGETARIELWDLRQRARLLQAGAPSTESFGTPSSLAASPDGRWIAVGHEDGTVRLWIVADQLQRLPRTIAPIGHSRDAFVSVFRPFDTDLALSEGGAFVASAALIERDGDTKSELVLCDILRGEPRFVLEQESFVATVAVSRDGALVATTERGGKAVVLREGSTGRVTRSISIPLGDLDSLVFSSDGSLLAGLCSHSYSKETNDYQSTLFVWDVASGDVRYEIPDVKWAMRFSPSEDLLACGRSSGDITLWNLEKGSAEAELTGHEKSVACLSFSADGQLLASASNDKAIKVWNVVNRQVVNTLSPGAVDVQHWSTIAFSSDGAFVSANPYPGNRLLTWNTGTGELISDLPVSRDIEALAFRDQGVSLLAACEDLHLLEIEVQPEPEPSFIAQAYYSRATERQRAEQYGKAEIDCTAAIRLHPRYTQAYLTRAAVRSVQGKHADAEADCNEVLKLTPENSSAYARRASVYLTAKEYEKAITDYDRVLEKSPEDVSALIGRGQCKVELGDFAGALEGFNKIPKVMLFNPPLDVLRYRGIAYVETGEYAKGLADLKRLAKIEPNAASDVSPWLEKAELEVGTAQPGDTTPGSQPTSPPRDLEEAAVAEEVAADQCILHLEVPEGATISILGRDYGTKRTITYKWLRPGKRYVSTLRVRFPNGEEAVRVLPVVGGREIHRSIMAPPMIALIKGKDEGRELSVYVINPDGTGERQLTQGTHDSNLTISPDGTKIAFTRRIYSDDREDWSDEIVVIHRDGTSAERLTDGKSPHWSPDGSKIAFTRATSPDSADIYVMNTDGTDIRRLAAGWFGDWSPDGSQIVFTRASDSGDHEIFVANSAGGESQQLTVGAHPDWSPDGSRIAFTHFERGEDGQRDGEIYVMKTDGSGARRLAAGESPAWSPGGSKIAFIAETDTGTQLVVMNPDGTGVRGLTPFDPLLSSPSADGLMLSGFNWSPDGQKLVYAIVETVSVKFHVRIEIVNRDGSETRELISDGGDPVWQ